jgi:hypothetical protein
MEKSTVLMSGAQAPKRESLGNRYPRKYISSRKAGVYDLT